MSTLQHTEASWHGSPAAAEGIITRLSTILRGVRSRRRARIALPRLHALSDKQLRDIGIERSQVFYLAYGASASLSRNRHAAD